MRTSSSTPTSQEAPMFDLTPSTPSFSYPTVTVSATSEAGKAYLESLYGTGAVSVELWKSFFGEWADKANANGLTVSA